MSQTIVALATIIAAQLLPRIGVTLGNDEITTAVSVLVTVIAALYAWVRRYKQGDITLGGVRL